MKHLTQFMLGTSLAAITTPAFAQEEAPIDDIIVTAQANNQTQVRSGGSIGVLGDKDALSVPFNIKSYNSALILNQQPQTLGQVLENDPSVRTTYGFGNASEQFVIRGFALFSDDVGINGLYGLAPRQVMSPEFANSVQVLNGASAFVNGAAPGGTGLGGSVNIVLKRAGKADLNRVTANYTSNGNFGGSFDLSRRLGDGSFGVRLNGVVRTGEVAINNEYRSAYVAGGAFDYDAGNFRASLDLGYQRIKIRGLRPKVTGATALPAVPRASANYSQPWTFTKVEDIFGIGRLEYDVADNATLYAAVGHRIGDENGNYGGISLTNTATGAASYSGSTVPFKQTATSLTAGLRAKLDGGWWTHEFNIGGSMLWQKNRTAFVFYNGAAQNLYNPVAIPFPGGTVSFASGNLADPPVSERNKTHSLFASDTIGFFDERVLFTAGIRLQYLTRNGNFSQYSGDAVTPAFGLVIKPTDRISLYANYMEGFEAGAAAPNTVQDGNILRTVINGGQVLPPAKTKQIEAGGKIAFGAMTASLGLFQIDRPLLATLPVGANQAVTGFLGTQRHQGVEFTLQGEVVDGLRVIGGASIINAKLRDTAGTAFATLQGNRAQGVPKYLINADVEWDTPFFPGFTLTGRVVQTGRQAANNANTFYLPSWTRFDLGARYVLLVGDSPLTLRASVDNVANKRYWASSFDSFGVGLLQGLPRTFKTSVSIDF